MPNPQIAGRQLADHDKEEAITAAAEVIRSMRRLAS